MDSINSAITPERIIHDLWMARGTQVLVAGIELEVFTHIAEGRHTAAEIAKAAKAKASALERLLNALVALGYLNKKKDRYGLEPLAAAFLVKGQQPYLGDFALETKLNWATWGRLTEVVKSGRPAMGVDSEAAGRDFFPKLVAAIFPMSFGAAQAAVVATRKSHARLRNILDVAAGSAAWSIPFAQALPEARVTALDFAEVLAITKRFTAQMGVADRYDYVEGNLRKTNFGRGRYDLVILGHIIHSEGEQWGRKLIKKSYDALSEGGLLLIGEMIPDTDRTSPVMPVLFDLNMLIHTEKGGVYTMRQYRQWLKEAGFKTVKTIAAPAPSPLILATK